jgi:hypothetical protein
MIKPQPFNFDTIGLSDFFAVIGINAEANKKRSYLYRYSIENLMKEFYEVDVDGRIDFLIMNCVCASANNQVYSDVHGSKSQDEYFDWSVSNDVHEYWTIQRHGLESARLLGAMLRKTDIDITARRMWHLMDSSYQFKCLEERGKRFHLDVSDIPCGAIAQAINDRNTIYTKDFVMIYSKLVLADDDYGRPTMWLRWKFIVNNDGARVSYFIEGSVADITYHACSVMGIPYMAAC